MKAAPAITAGVFGLAMAALVFSGGAPTAVRAESSPARVSGGNVKGTVSASEVQVQTGERAPVLIDLRAREDLRLKAGGKVLLGKHTFRIRFRRQALSAGEQRTIRLRLRNRFHERLLIDALKRGDVARAKVKAKLVDASRDTRVTRLRLKLTRDLVDGPPETVLESGPAELTNYHSPSFSFSASEPSTFECRIDSAAYASCGSPKAYSDLPAGDHTFKVRAVDRVGLADPTPVKYSFTVAPNILLIITDDQPHNTMQVMPRTREFFGGQGTEFIQGYDVQPLCCPSRASIFSGKYPHNHGITVNDGTGFDASETWQRLLQDRGYYTGIIGKYLNKVRSRDAPFFDYHWRPNTGGEITDLEKSSAEFFESVEQSDQQPWALVYSPVIPHYPWDVTARDPQPIPPYDPPPSLNEADLTDKHPAVTEFAETRWDPTRTDLIRTGQLQELQALDETLGKLFGDLEQLGEVGNTLSLYISDNGLMWGQHSVGSKSWPYIESVRVPFFAHWPGRIAEGEVDSRLVANIDIAPTILDAAGVEPEYPIDGRPLFGAGARDWLLLELPTFIKSQGVPPWSAYITSERQYVEWTDGFVEDYDLNLDPWQISASNLPDPVIASLLEQARTCAGAACP